LSAVAMALRGALVLRTAQSHDFARMVSGLTSNAQLLKASIGGRTPPPFNIDASSRLAVLPEIHSARAAQAKHRYQPLLLDGDSRSSPELIDLQRAAEIAKHINDRDVTVEILDRTAEHFYYKGDVDGEIVQRREAVKLLGSEPHPSQVLALNSLAAALLRKQQDSKQAEQCLSAAAQSIDEIFHDLSSSSSSSSSSSRGAKIRASELRTLTRLNKAVYLYATEQIKSARDILNDVVNECRDSAELVDLNCAALNMLAKVSLDNGDVEAALGIYGQAFQLPASVSHAWTNATTIIAMSLVQVGEIAIDREAWDLAEASLEAARAILLDPVGRQQLLPDGFGPKTGS